MLCPVFGSKVWIVMLFIWWIKTNYFNWWFVEIFESFQQETRPNFSVLRLFPTWISCRPWLHRPSPAFSKSEEFCDSITLLGWFFILKRWCISILSRFISKLWQLRLGENFPLRFFYWRCLAFRREAKFGIRQQFFVFRQFHEAEVQSSTHLYLWIFKLCLKRENLWLQFGQVEFHVLFCDFLV